MKYVLAGLGTLVVCIGVLIQFLDWRRHHVTSGKIEQLRSHADWLRDSVSDLEREPKTKGMVTSDGIDIGQAFEIMEGGARQARDDTRQQLNDLLDGLDDDKAKRYRPMYVSWWLIGLGTAIAGAANFV